MSLKVRFSAPAVVCAFAAALVFSLLSSPARADIAWSAAAGIANDNDVLAAGTAVYAYDWANANIAVNGVNFTGTSVDTGAVDANLSLGSGFGSTLAACNTGASGAFGALTTAYQTLLGGLVYGANSTVTMNNLQSGHQYAVQVWDCDTNVSSGQYTTLSSGASTQRIYANPTGVYGGVGQYSVGYFTASGASQAFTNGTNDGTTMPAMTAMQLRDVTNIGYWNGLGGNTWDNTTTTSNFCTNVYSAPLANGTFAAATALVPNVYFGDYYYNGSGTVAVAQNSVTVGAGGVSAAAVNFTNNSVPYTISSADSAGITGATAVNVGGGGMVTFVGTNTYTGATTISAGTLAVGAAGLLGGGNYAGNIAISNSGALVMNTSANQTFGGVISGAGGLTQAGGGVLDLTGANTFTGGTTVSGGTLVLDSSVIGQNIGVLQPNTNLAISNATVSLRGTNKNALFCTTGGTTTIGIGGVLSADMSSTGLIAGNLYYLTMQGGTLAATVGPGNAYGNFAVNSGSVAATGNNPSTISANIASGTSALVFNVDNGSNGTGGLLVSGAIYNGGGSALTKTGTGTLTLTGTNAYIGATTISAGTLQIGGAGVLGGGNYAGAISVSNSGALIMNSSGNQTFSGVISGAGGLTRTGGGVLDLTGANTFTGGTTVSGGTLILDSSVIGASIGVLRPNTNLAISNATVSVRGTNNNALYCATGGTTTIGIGGVLSADMSSTGLIAGNLYYLTMQGGTLAATVGPGNAWGNFAVNSGSVAATGNNPSTISANIGSGGTALAFNVDNGSNGTGGLLVSGAIENGNGGTALTKTGTGTLTLTGANAYTGGTTISAGTLQIGGAGVLAGGNYAGAISVASSAALIVNSSNNQTFSGGISGSGPWTQAGLGDLTLASAANTYSGPTTVTGGTLTVRANIKNTSLISVASGATLDAEADFVTNGSSPTAAVPIYVNGTFNTGVGCDQTVGNITLGGGTLSGSAPGDSTYGNYTIFGGNSITSSGNSLISAAGRVSFYSGSSPVLVDVQNPSDVLTISAGMYDVGSTSGITKSGSGTLILSGSDTYTGATTVNAGALSVTGSLAGAVAVDNGGLLNGNGSIGNLYVYSGGTLAPGYTAGAGTLNVTAATLASGSVLNYTLGAAPLVSVSGNLNLPASGGTLNILDSSLSTGTYALFNYSAQTGLTPNTFTIGMKPSSLSGDVFAFKDTGSALDLVIESLINGQWNTNGGGTWSGTANWTGGVPGTGVADTAVFGTALTSGSATVTLDSSRSLASLGFSTTGGASYTINASGASTLTLANPAGSATISDSGGNHTINAPIVLGSNLSVTPTTGSSLSVAGGISDGGTGMSVTLGGGGTLFLSGANTYSGSTIIANGVLNFVNNAIPTSGANNKIIFSGSSGTLQWATGNTQDISANLTALTAGQTATLDTNGQSVTFTSNASYTGGATGTLVKAGQGTLTVATKDWNSAIPIFLVNTAASGSNSGIAGGAMAANLQVTAGTVQIPGSTGYLWIGPLGNESSGTVGVSAGGVINSAYLQMGFGLLTSTATCNSVLNISGGTVLTTANVAYALNICGGGVNQTSTVNLSAGLLSLTGAAAGAALFDSSNANAKYGTTVFNLSGGTFSVPNGPIYTGYPAGSGTANSNNLNFNFTGGVLTAGTIDNSMPAITQSATSGPSLLDVSGNNTLVGVNYTLAGNSTAAATVNVGAGHALTMSNNTTLTLGNYAQFGAGSGTIAGAVTVTGSTNASFAGSIADLPGSPGSGLLTMNGLGVLTLTGTSSYSGDTTVNGGALSVTGSLNGSGAVNVNGGGLLSGNGSVGNVTVVSAGTLAPGYTAGAGTLNVANLTLQSGSVLNYTLGAPSGSNGYVNVSGYLNLPASGVTLNLANGGSLTPGTYAMFQYGGSLTGATSGVFTAGNVPSALSGDSFSFSESSGNVIDLVISGGGPTNGVWATNGPGTWSGTANWTGGVPGSGQDTAVFGAALTSGTATVTLDGSRSLASLGFSTTGGNSYVIAASGASTLTLANTLTSTAALSNSGGNHAINAPIVLGSNLNVSATTGSALTIAGGISESSPSTSVSVGGGGEVILSGTDTYTGGTNVTAATLAITSASALSSTGVVTISGGGKLVLGSGAGIGALLTASAPISSGAVALSAAASVPATLAPLGNSVENMATLGGAPSLSQGGGGSAVGVTAAAVPEPGTLALLAAAAMTAAAALRRRRK